MKDFFHKYEENPNQLGRLLIFIGCLAGFGYAVIQFYILFFTGFAVDLSFIDLYSIIVPSSGIVLGILALKFRNSLKYFKKDTNYRIYTILVGIGFLVISNFMAGILIFAGSLFLFYKK